MIFDFVGKLSSISVAGVDKVIKRVKSRGGRGKIEKVAWPDGEVMFILYFVRRLQLFVLFSDDVQDGEFDFKNIAASLMF